MKRRTLICWLLCLALFAIPGFAFDDDDVKLLLRVAPQNLQAILDKFDLEVEDAFPEQNLYLVEWEGGDDNDDSDDDDDDDDDDDSESLDRFLQRVRRDPRVLAIEVNQELELREDDDNPLVAPNANPASQALVDRQLVPFHGTQALKGYVEQPAAHRIEVDEVRSLASGAGIVAIIDTGVDTRHPLLRDRLLPGFDFTRNQPVADEIMDLNGQDGGVLTQEAAVFLESLRPTNISSYATPILTQEAAVFLEGARPPSAFGHGTMVAGLVRFTAPDAWILPVKAFDANGKATLFNLVRSIYYSASKGARVINMSFTLAQPSAEFTRAIHDVTMQGVVCVAASGNDGLQTMVYPAGFPTVIGVASTNANDQRSAFSNFGPQLVTLAAPGEGLITTYPGGYAAAWGTSFSTPLVAGAVALMEQLRPGTTVDQAIGALSQAKPIGDAGLGFGRLDVSKALAGRLVQP
ncbi:MAG: S8 family serine peptidase [Bryobacter sp.]|nr:S8 family serine peptidase [Bryobacter sp.]